MPRNISLTLPIVFNSYQIQSYFISFSGGLVFNLFKY
jgi:hypothetical protein